MPLKLKEYEDWVNMLNSKTKNTAHINFLSILTIKYRGLERAICKEHAPPYCFYDVLELLKNRRVHPSFSDSFLLRQVYKLPFLTINCRNESGELWKPDSTTLLQFLGGNKKAIFFEGYEPIIELRTLEYWLKNETFR